MRDDDVRMSCFLSLDVLRAKHGDDIPYVGALDQGFPFRGSRVPFLSYMKGIFRAAAQRGRAALAIVTSAKSPYDDEETDLGSSMPAARRVLITVGAMLGPMDDREPVPIVDEIDRRYAYARRRSGFTRRASADSCCPAY